MTAYYDYKGNWPPIDLTIEEKNLWRAYALGYLSVYISPEKWAEATERANQYIEADRRANQQKVAK